MATLAILIEKAVYSVKSTYNRLGENDIEETDLDDFSNSGIISREDLDTLKASLNEAAKMESSYSASLGINKLKSNLKRVEDCKKYDSFKPQTNRDNEKERDD